MRINQYIASAGVTSRRKADELIEEGRVKVNGAVLTSPGYHVERASPRLTARCIICSINRQVM